MAPISFALAIQEVISRLTCPFNVWFLDDGTFGGNLDQALGDLSVVSQQFADLGLQLNPAKCEITVLGGPSSAAHQYAIGRAGEIMPNIRETSLGNLSLLGSPLGTNSMESSEHACVERVKMICQRLAPLDAHWALFFLSRYVSAPRVNYLLRVSPMYRADEALLIIDGCVRHTLSERINVNLSDDAWKQASLPVRFGGLGVRSVASLALPCFLASTHSSQALVASILEHSGVSPDPDYSLAALEDFRERYNDPVLPIGDALCRQQEWDGITCRYQLDRMLHSAKQVHRARLLAASSLHSGSWLMPHLFPASGCI